MTALQIARSHPLSFFLSFFLYFFLSLFLYLFLSNLFKSSFCASCLQLFSVSILASSSMQKGILSHELVISATVTPNCLKQKNCTLTLSHQCELTRFRFPTTSSIIFFCKKVFGSEINRETSFVENDCKKRQETTPKCRQNDVSCFRRCCKTSHEMFGHLVYD